MKGRTFLVALLLVALNGYGQSIRRPLQVGDPVPDIPLQLIQYSSDSAQLFTFTQGYVLLDFWATSCSSCLLKFPLLDSLRSIYPAFQVLGVTGYRTTKTKVRVEQFLEKMKGKFFLPRFPLVVEDTTLTDLFPFASIPHYVWIRHGTVWAITNWANPIDATTVSRFLQDEKF
ncbi:MAG: hypothetical protein J0I32_08995 [Sphingobacteriales bacterium]|nr:hypothetical protein [Sphingobacteriales bacterium]OJW00133.1 MAG: hypothetical protein BGO52_03335 [Sphingobacteriales bacterium 44-61]